MSGIVCLERRFSLSHALLLALTLSIPLAASAADPASMQVVPTPVAPAAAPQPPAPTMPAAVPAAPAAASASPLPAMYFVSSLANDDLYKAFKAMPAFSALDDELVGSPLKLVVTHTNRPTAGGQAAGLVSAVLSGSTLGIIPIVSNEQLVVRYEVMLNGKTITSHSFERTATRAMSIWSGADAYAGLGKGGMDWVKSTVTQAGAKLAADPALMAVRKEIDFYFSAPSASTTQPVTTTTTPGK